MAIINYDGKITYKECVLKIWEQNCLWDSDFYADVWDEKLKKVTTIQYGTTRYACDTSAEVDINEDNYVKAMKYLTKLEYFNIIKKDKNTIEQGDEVEVVKGRKVKIGTKGTVIGIYNNSYQQHNRKIRLLLSTGEKVYTYENNLKKKDMNINDKIDLKVDLMTSKNINTFEI